jgi:hypothetical protein
MTKLNKPQKQRAKTKATIIFLDLKFINKNSENLKTKNRLKQ